MNLNYYMLKKHIFKKRERFFTTKKTPKLKFGSVGLYSTRRQKFEFVYIRLLKKFFRRKYIKAYIPFMKPKFWLFVRSNYILSAKSKNARMGAGVGALVRTVFALPPLFFLMEFRHYPAKYVSNVCLFFSFKTKVSLLVYA